MEKVSSDLILDWVTKQVENKTPPSKEEWLTIAFKLNILGLDEQKLLNKMRQSVAQKKLEALNKQIKRNVAAAELEVEASNEYLLMKDQEAKCDTITEFVRVAKKSAETYY